MALQYKLGVLPQRSVGSRASCCSDHAFDRPSTGITVNHGWFGEPRRRWAGLHLAHNVFTCHTNEGVSLTPRLVRSCVSQHLRGKGVTSS